LTVESKQSDAPEESQDQKGLLDVPVNHLISPPTSWKKRPWDIDLLEILKELQDRIILSDQVNLSQAGRAIAIGSNLHRKRADHILKEEKSRVRKKERKQQKPSNNVSGNLILPQTPRIVNRRVNTLDLLNALSRAIQIVKRKRKKSSNSIKTHFDDSEEDLLSLLPEELVLELDLGSESIEQFINQVNSVILQQFEQNGDSPIGFYALVQQMLGREEGISNIVYKDAKDRLTRLYIVRILLSILYLILRNKITVNQTEFFSDLQIQPITTDLTEAL